MSRTIPESEFEAVLQAVERIAGGARLEQVELVLEGLDVSLPRRTLQRRLAHLLAEKRLRIEGRGRGLRYWPGGKVLEFSSNAIAQASAAAACEILIPLSAEGRTLEREIRQPMQKRQPVGYNQRFLDGYQPNGSRYLSEDVCQELRSAGQASRADSPAGTYARQIFSRLLIDLSWNSSRLEGNTYSLLETERLLSVGEMAAGRGALEAQMIFNHKAAIEFLVESADEIGFNSYTVLNLHALLSDNLLSDPTASGRLRTIAVGIGQTVFHPLEVPQRIEACFAQILDKAAAIDDPFEQAFFAMVHLPYLQPFEDVNKRVSRLAANIPLIKHNLCPLSFVDVVQQSYIDAMLGIYELNRVELLRDVFVWAYKRSCARYSAVRQSLGEPDPFRFRYRTLIAETVANVVRSKMGKGQAIAAIRKRAESDVPELDRARFVEVSETEAMSLHEGNIARYRLRPSEFLLWRAGWK